MKSKNPIRLFALCIALILPIAGLNAQTQPAAKPDAGAAPSAKVFETTLLLSGQSDIDVIAFSGTDKDVSTKLQSYNTANKTNYTAGGAESSLTPEQRQALTKAKEKIRGDHGSSIVFATVTRGKAAPPAAKAGQ